MCNPALVGIVGDPSVPAIQSGSETGVVRDLARTFGATVTPGALAYVTGGLAVGEIMTAGTVFGLDGDGNPVTTIVSSHNTKAGWTVGGGIEAPPHRQLDCEARIPLSRSRHGLDRAVARMNATVAPAFNSRVTDNVVRVGVNYKFNPNQIWTND